MSPQNKTYRKMILIVKFPPGPSGCELQGLLLKKRKLAPRFRKENFINSSQNFSFPGAEFDAEYS